MKTATITQTKNQLSMLIDAVKQGESILILDRDVPVARLAPVTATRDQDMDTYLSQLERTGHLRRKKNDLPDNFFESPRAKLNENESIVEALVMDREEGR